MKRAAEPEAHASAKKHKHKDKSRKHSDGYQRTGERQQQYNDKYLGDSKEDLDTRLVNPPSKHDKAPAPAPAPASKQAVSYSAAVDQLPPPTSVSADIPSYVPFTVSRGLPTLPTITSPKLATAPFKHKSLLPSYDRNSTSSDISYERLEFLGDAYIEVIASRLIFERFSHLPAGQQSQLRELLVKNETLAEYSRAYKFDEKLETGSKENMLRDIEHKDKWKGNKGWNKIMGDVFEAYVAAVILADAEFGFVAAEKWLTALWAPKLLEAAMQNRVHVDLVHSADADARRIYNPNAKQELQRKIMGGRTRLEYETYKDSVELKGDQLGQNKHFIAVYFTGFGYERKLLGKGEGKNKVEAGNWAATEAMYGENKAVVDECAEKLRAEKEERAAMRAAKAAEEAPKAA